MMMNNDNPVLQESLRRSYRSDRASPYLAQRVIATVESDNQSRTPWLKYAGGLISVVFMVLVLQPYFHDKTTETPGSVSITTLPMGLSSTAVLSFPNVDIDVPGLSSLGNVPSVNHFNTPARSLYNPGDFCIYQQTGEISC